MTTTRVPNPEKALFAEGLISIFSIIGTILALGWVLWYSRYGIDFTDESFYLVWLSNPFIYSESTTQFGFIYHSLYGLLEGNIAALRQANILFTFGLAWVLGHIFLKVVFANSRIGRLQRMALSSGFATASLLFLVSWLPTPSYDSLALQALLIAAIGLLLIESRLTVASLSGLVLVGVGGWLAFMAKPTTAAALGCSVGAYLLGAKKIHIRLLAVSLGTALVLLFLSAWIIDGSIANFIRRLDTGVELSGYLGGGHSIVELLRIDDFYLGGRNRTSMIVLISIILCASFLLQSPRQTRVACGIVLTAVGLAFVLSTTFGLRNSILAFGTYRGLLILTIPLSALFLGVFYNGLEGVSKVTSSHWMLALFFLVLPHVYAFGTNGNYWQAGSAAGLFWVLSGLVLLAPATRESKPWPLLFPLIIALQVIVVALIQTGLETPYRQPQPLRFNNSPTEIGRPGSELILSAGYSHYLEEAKSAARIAGLKAGTPVIDLSGQSPGILYALGATSVGQAWLIGGYPGSAALALKALKRVPCNELASAWVLLEAGGPRSISSDALAGFGADASKHYESVASWEVAEGAGGYKKRRSQQLLKPVRSITEASQACAAAGETLP